MPLTQRPIEDSYKKCLGNAFDIQVNYFLQQDLQQDFLSFHEVIFQILNQTTEMYILLTQCAVF